MRKHLLHLSLLIVLATIQAAAQPLPASVFKQVKARSVGPGVMSGRITAVDAVVANPDIIYAGAASGGVWKSENGGLSWKPVFDEQSNINIGSLAIQQSNPSVVWAGTGEGNPRNSINLGNGIYKTIDGGRTWKRMGLEKTINIHRILIDPTNPNIVYAGVIGNPFGEHPERGVYKTTDGGQSWERVLYTNEKSGVADMVMDPGNPNKLVVAMWQHRRTPWDFQSGGPGSGLYITYDGGKTWSKKGKAEGLPEGDFGRLGLAIARSMPNRIYALVEAGKNGLYRSGDGGEKWEKVTEDPSIVTNRPFYFNEIFVDPKNENRLYMIYQPIAVSEDGGKSFKVIATLEQVHADHHAFWIHPDNPNFIIDGNDGGIAISRDRGKTWIFPEGIAIGQFYHINVDNEIPYNIYGGLQDNGSWTGPSYTFAQGGLRNYYWQVVLYGDGFDVVPDPEDSRYGYAMSQGGNLARYDKQTGRSSFIKPISPDTKTRLRFNWNAGVALDPTDKRTLYYGSQFLHKSSDKGLTWETISPDLTLNKPEQQRQDQSGGLTLDITSAENHNTILTIAPSQTEKGVIWVGTDDGNIQLTRDGGKTWSNLRDRLPGLPKEAWIPQITTSRHRPGEAFVVANHYRMGNDFAPYIYRTTNYGQSWTRLVDEKKVNGYALCFLQDPTEPRLMFAGTEHGLWVSIDEGQTWTQWKEGMPSVSTMDLAIQEREADLVIGTFGRAIYVLDDIRPLRRLANQGLNKTLDRPLVAFEPAEAYLANYRNPVGYMNETDNLYQATNRPAGATLTYYLKPKPIAAAVTASAKPAEPAAKGRQPRQKVTVNKETGNVLPTELPAGKADTTQVKKAETKRTDTLYVRLYNERNQLIRTLKQVPDSALGMQRLTWNLTERGLRQPGSTKPKPADAEPAGTAVLPGRYKAVFAYAGAKDSTMVTVKEDPRVPYNREAIMARRALLDRLDIHTRYLTEATDRIQEATEAADLLTNQLKDRTGADMEALRKTTKTMQDSLKALRDMIVGKKIEKQGYGRPYMLTPVSKLQEARMYIGGRTEPVTQTETLLVQQAEQLAQEALNKVNQFFRSQWVDYSTKVEAAPLPIVKTYAEIK
ncbi:WD40/YVTN/BNR-like repeat-containing protein [Nibrella viscosa]